MWFEAWMLLDKWMYGLKGTLEGKDLKVKDVRISVFYTAVMLSTGHVGVAFTPRGLEDTVCCPRSASVMPESGRLTGRSAWELAEYSKSIGPLKRALGVATLNALSSLGLELQGLRRGRVLLDTDPVDVMGIDPDNVVVLIGAFTPYIRRFKERVEKLYIVEKNPRALKRDELKFWKPAGEAGEALKEADVVLMSGSVLVEGGIDELLGHARGSKVAIIGPTTPPWPEPFFDAGVYALGGIEVLDGERMLELVGEGGSGYIFERDGAARKVCFLRE